MLDVNKSENEREGEWGKMALSLISDFNLVHLLCSHDPGCEECILEIYFNS